MSEYTPARRHTPEPWKVREEPDLYSRIIIDGPEGAVVAEVLNADDFVCVGDEDAHDIHFEALANADLIAAAPELFEACKAALPILRAYIHPDQFDGHAARALLLLRDAVDKVEGRS